MGCVLVANFVLGISIMNKMVVAQSFARDTPATSKFLCFAIYAQPPVLLTSLTHDITHQSPGADRNAGRREDIKRLAGLADQLRALRRHIAHLI